MVTRRPVAGLQRPVLLLMLLGLGGTTLAGQSATVTPTWNANSDAAVAGYVLEYGTSPGSYTTSIDVGNVTSYQLTLAPGTYYFVVRAYYVPSRLSAASPETSGGVFSDQPLVVGSTMVKAAHVLELRSRIDAARLVRGLAAYAWSESVAAGDPIKAVHITELRTAVAALYAVPPTYTDPGLTAGTAIKAAHLSELRDAVATIEAIAP